MQQRHLGVDFSSMGHDLQLAVTAEGRKIDSVHFAARRKGGEWEPCDLVTEGPECGFVEGLVELQGVDPIVILQQEVQAAGYQWMERGAPDRMGERTTSVSITKMRITHWNESTPNVVTFGPEHNRLSCWKQARDCAIIDPAVGSQLARKNDDACERVHLSTGLSH